MKIKKIKLNGFAFNQKFKMKYWFSEIFCGPSLHRSNRDGYRGTMVPHTGSEDCQERSSHAWWHTSRNYEGNKTIL